MINKLAELFPEERFPTVRCVFTGTQTLTEATYRRALREGIAYTVRVLAKGAQRYAKVIVYDYASDLLGSATVRMR